MINAMRFPYPSYVQGLAKFADSLPSGSVVVEIGSFSGESAQIFLDSGKVSLLHCVDPFDYSIDPAGGFGHQYSKDDIRASLMERVVENPKYVGMVKFHQMTSVQAMKLFENRSIDMVYIDGNHRDPFVKEDIVGWTPKVKIGGIVAGHDYRYAGNPGGEPAVTKYVLHYFGEPDKIYDDHSWVKVLTQKVFDDFARKSTDP